jgi:hypothetical protein
VNAASFPISRNGDGIVSKTRISSSGRGHPTRVLSSGKNAPPGNRKSGRAVLSIALAKLPARTLVVDGEVLRSRFEWLREPDAVASPPLFMVFDLLFHDRRDLTARPLRDRRARLEDVVANSDLVFPVRRLAPDGLATPAVAGGGHSRLRGATDSGDVDDAGQEFERLLMAHLLRHTGSPVMRWMVANVIVTSRREHHAEQGQVR